jgi:hypothetical protein
MTRDEIIEMARQADVWTEKDFMFADVLNPKIEAFAKLVAAKHDPKIAIADAYRAGVDSGIAAEREACAKVCEEHGKVWAERFLLGFQAVLDDAADAIRARGEAV